MNNYLFELAVVHLTLTLGYWLLLRDEHQYATMRFYLLASTLSAIIIPLLKLSNPLNISFDLGANIPFPDLTANPTVTPYEYIESGGSSNIISGVYMAISIFFLVRFIAAILKLIYLERKSTYEKFKNLYIRKVPGISGSFTFFNWIFLGAHIERSESDYEVILTHEKAHIHLGHSYDIIFLELFKILFWWLPTTWYINKEIRKIHEYQADSSALKSWGIDKYSDILISTTLKAQGISLTSSFYDQSILKRLQIMKQKIKSLKPWKSGILASLFLSLFVIFACTDEPEITASPEYIQAPGNAALKSSEGEIFTVVEQQPTYPGGINALNNLVEREMKYPAEALRKGIEGRVYVSFIVEKDGSLTNFQLMRGIDLACDQEAVRLVQLLGKFEPGLQKDKAVRTRMVLPIAFKIK